MPGTEKKALIIMASGNSRRFGGNKLLADFDGKPLFRHILDSSAALPGLRRLVLTRHAEIYAHCLATGTEAVLHTLPLRNEAIRLGIEILTEGMPDVRETILQYSLYREATPLSGCIFCLADQPLLTQESLLRLSRAADAEPGRILCLSFQGQRGAPVYFPAALFPELTALPDRCGGRHLIQKDPELVSEAAAGSALELADVDTPEALRALETALQRSRELT